MRAHPVFQLSASKEPFRRTPRAKEIRKEKDRNDRNDRQKRPRAQAKHEQSTLADPFLCLPNSPKPLPQTSHRQFMAGFSV